MVADIIGLIFAALIAIFCTYMAIRVQRRNNKKKRLAVQQQEAEATATNDVPEDNNAASEEEDYQKRRERRYAEYQEYVKNEKASIVAGFLYASIDLETITNIYEVEKKIDSYNYERNELLSMGDSDLYVKQGIAEYNRKRKEGVYETRRATIKDDAHIITEHRALTDITPYIVQGINGFERYWDRELTLYKRKSYYLKRVDYLVEHIGELLQKPYIQNNITAVNMLHDLRQKYDRLREQQ